MTSSDGDFTWSDIEKARDRIIIFVHRTPVLTCSTINGLCNGGRQLYFKAENFQKTGSFKARGALNAACLYKESLKDDGSSSGHVVTHSSGNHGQALAYAAQTLNMKCTVVVPDNAPMAKTQAMRSYGAEIKFCQSNMRAREETCAELVKNHGYHMIHPHDDLNVMAGQGTLAVEFLEDVPQLDAILVAVGGGGLLSGVATAVKHMKRECRVFAVEPVGKQLGQSFQAGHPLDVVDHSKLLNTVADGIRVRCLGHHCFPVSQKLCEKQVFTVDDNAIIEAMFLIYERMKIIVEPSAAICLAAALSDQFKALPAHLKHIGVVLCGGNVDLKNLPWKN